MLAVTTPARVRPGDTVAVVSPSAPGVAWWPHRAERGRAYLESLGLNVRFMPHAAGKQGWVSASAEARARDIHDAFLDDEVTVVLASTGGNHSNQLLPYIDYDVIRSHPKIFQGYSDITVLHWAFLKHAGLRTFHGPVLSVELAEYPEVLPYTDRHLRSAWFGAELLRFEPASEWTDEFIPWNGKDDVSRPRELRPSSGWITIREGIAEGPLIGGAIETVCWHLKGSDEWPDLGGALFFLELSEETPSPAHVDAYLTDLSRLGVFEAVSGLIFGRPVNYDSEQAQTLWRVVAERSEAAGIPVLANVDLGHADPMLTLPLGARAVLDAGAQTFELLEPATREATPGTPPPLRTGVG